VVDYVNRWKDRAEIPAHRILGWMGVPEGTYYNWKKRYGMVNEHNGWIPRDHWLEDWEKKSILDYYWEHLLDGYRRLTYKMLDANIVAVSASSRPTFGRCPPGSEGCGCSRQTQQEDLQQGERVSSAERATQTLAYRY
jgi:hypothetical protein